MVPTIQECYRLMDAYQMLDNIKAHSVVVAKAARLIAQGLRQANTNICVETVTVGALLHDIGKTASLTSGEDHSEIGRGICLRHHFEEIAPLVAEHVRMKDYSLMADYCEKEIIFYADKRVNHDQIVSLNERLRYILERYARGKGEVSRAIRQNFSLCQQVEGKLFRALPFGPEDLAHQVARCPALL